MLSYSYFWLIFDCVAWLSNLGDSEKVIRRVETPGVYLTGLDLTAMHLASHGRAPCICVPHGRAPCGRAPHRRGYHGPAPYGRAPHGPASHGHVPHERGYLLMPSYTFVLSCSHIFIFPREAPI